MSAGRLLRRAHIRVEAPMRMFREVDSAGRLLRSLLSAPADQGKKIGVYLKPQASKGTPIGVYLKPQQGTIHQKNKSAENPLARREQKLPWEGDSETDKNVKINEKCWKIHKQ